MSGEKVSRRGYLKYASAGVVVVAGAAAGAYYATRPPTTTMTGTTATTVPTATIVPTATTTAGPGIDYYYDPKLNGTEIKFMAANVDELAFTQKTLALFEKETGITVDIVTMPEDDVTSKSGIGFAAKSSEYDIIHASAFGSFAYDYFLSGFIESFEPYIEKTPSGWRRDDISDPILESCSSKGELFTLPHMTGDYMQFYRTDLITSAPRTYDELLSATKQANNPPGVFGLSMAGTPDIFSFFPYEMFLWGYGGTLFDESFHPQLNTDEAYKALELMIKLSKYCPSFTSTDNVGASTIFSQGRAADLLGFADVWASYVTPEGSTIKGKCGYTPHPFDVSEPHMMAGITMAINKFSKSKDAAWSFISYETSPRVQLEQFILGMAGSIRKSVYENPEAKKVNSYGVEVLGWLEGAKLPGSGAPKVAAPILPKIPRVGEFVGIVVPNMAEAIVGTVSVKQAMDASQEQATKLMKDIGLI